MPIYHDGKKMKPYRGYRKPVNVYYGDKKVAGWKNSTQTGNNLTFQTTYNDTADVVVKGKTLQKSEWVHKQGLTTQDGFAVNDEITVPYRGYNLTFRIVHINGELVTLEMKYVFGSSSAYKSIQFDGTEALYFAETGLAAGTYNFTLLAGYDVAYGGGKTYQFTLAQDVPAGGCLMFPWGYQVQADTVKISSYASLTATTAIESVSVMDGSGGNSLGVADGNTPNMNHTHRIRYGSNNYAQSAIRQWLNSSAALGSVWTPQTKFDRPPTYHTSSDPAYAGFMNGLEPNFLAAVEATVIPCRTNGNFEVNSLDGTEFAINQTYNLTDKFFLLSRPEIYGTWDSASYKDGELLEFYDGLTDTERIKYDAFGAARIAWLRSPSSFFAYNARSVVTDGSLSSYNAHGDFGVAAACNVKISNLQTLIDTGTISYTHANPSPLYPQPLISNLPAGTYKVQDHKGDFYEFTLDEDLHGIGTTKDSVEFNKYSHKGHIKRSFGKKVFDGSETWDYSATTDTNIYRYYSNVDNLKTISSGEMPLMYCTHYPIIAGGATYNKIQGCTASTSSNQAIYIFDNNINEQNTTPFKNWLASLHANGTPLTVVYQLATPTRTPLTFTLNNASTATECPMEFLTDTPSLEYPAEVFDAQGTITSRNADDTQSVTAPIPPLRKIGDVADTYNPKTGEYVQRIGVKVFDGSEGISNTNAVPLAKYASVAFDGSGRAEGVYIMSSHFIMSPTGHAIIPTANKEYIWGNKTAAQYGFVVLLSNLSAYGATEDRATHPTAFKSFLASQYAAGTPVTVYYQLAEPVVTYLDPATLPTYYPTTVITTANDTPAELTTTATVKVEDEE